MCSLQMPKAQNGLASADLSPWFLEGPLEYWRRIIKLKKKLWKNHDNSNHWEDRDDLTHDVVKFGEAPSSFQIGCDWMCFATRGSRGGVNSWFNQSAEKSMSGVPSGNQR